MLTDIEKNALFTKHVNLATAVMVSAFDDDGWQVLSKRTRKFDGEEFAVVELVVRKGDAVQLKRWHPVELAFADI